MGQTERSEVANPAPPINIACNWTRGYVTMGTEVYGDLVLISTTPGVDIVLTAGEQLVFLDLPKGWTIAPDGGDWVSSTFPYRGQTLPALTYQGDSFSLRSFVRTLAQWVEPEQEDMVLPQDSGTPIALGVTAPKVCPPMVQVSLQLFGADAAPLSTPSTVLFSAVSQSAPFVAYSTAPSAVLLTQPKATEFPNVLDAVLQNLTSQPCAKLNATLAITAQTSGGDDVPITAALGTVEVFGGTDQWLFDPATHSWSATLSNIRPLGPVTVTISNLALDDPTIALVLATFTLDDGSDKTDIYSTVAWYQSYGPYALKLALSTEVDTAIFYRLTKAAQGAYAVNTLNPKLRAPPLQPNLIDHAGEVIYPPIPGWYSWSASDPVFPSNFNLQNGQNNLYFLVKSTGGKMMPLTTGTVDYNFTPNEIYSAGYQQTYGSDQTQFGPIMPPGAIILWNGSPANIPAGWVLCDGTNNTPNLQSRFVIGGGPKEVPNTFGDPTPHTHNVSINQTYTTTTDGSHSHLMPAGWYNRNLSCGKYTGIDVASQDITKDRVQNDGAHSHTVTVTLSEDSGPTVAPRPAWYALCYIMKL